MDTNTLNSITRKIIQKGNVNFTDNKVVTNFVIAHARHMYTGYDDLLKDGMTKHDARQAVHKSVHSRMKFWSMKKPPWIK